MYEVLCLNGISWCEATCYRASVLGSVGVSLWVWVCVCVFVTALSQTRPSLLVSRAVKASHRQVSTAVDAHLAYTSQQGWSLKCQMSMHTSVLYKTFINTFSLTSDGFQSDLQINKRHTRDKVELHV